MSIFELLIPIIFVIISGYLVSKYNLLHESSSTIFTRFAFIIAMPCQLFIDFSKTPINLILNIDYILSFSICTLVIGILIFIYSRYYLKNTISESALNIMGAAQVNTAYFAIPIFTLIFNNATPVIPILLFQVLILTTIILFIIEYDINSERKKSTIILNSLSIPFKNPIIIASALGFIFSLFTIKPPLFVENSLNLLGGISAPLVLFSLGQSLFFDLKKINKSDVNEVTVISIVKLFIFPLLAFFIGKYLFNLNNFWLSSLIIMAAMPAPKNMYIFANNFNLNTKKPSSIVAITTLVSLITLNLIISLIK